MKIIINIIFIYTFITQSLLYNMSVSCVRTKMVERLKLLYPDDFADESPNGKLLLDALVYLLDDQMSQLDKIAKIAKIHCNNEERYVAFYPKMVKQLEKNPENKDKIMATYNSWFSDLADLECVKNIWEEQQKSTKRERDDLDKLLEKERNLIRFKNNSEQLITNNFLTGYVKYVLLIGNLQGLGLDDDNKYSTLLDRCNSIRDQMMECSLCDHCQCPCNYHKQENKPCKACSNCLKKWKDVQCMICLGCKMDNCVNKCKCDEITYEHKRDKIKHECKSVKCVRNHFYGFFPVGYNSWYSNTCCSDCEKDNSEDLIRNHRPTSIQVNSKAVYTQKPKYPRYYEKEVFSTIISRS